MHSGRADCDGRSLALDVAKSAHPRGIRSREHGVSFDETREPGENLLRGRRRAAVFPAPRGAAIAPDRDPGVALRARLRGALGEDPAPPSRRRPLRARWPRPRIADAPLRIRIPRRSGRRRAGARQPPRRAHPRHPTRPRRRGRPAPPGHERGAGDGDGHASGPRLDPRADGRCLDPSRRRVRGGDSRSVRAGVQGHGKATQR